MVDGGGVVGGEWTVRHTAVDFELLSSFTELGLCACKCVYTYLELALRFTPGSWEKNSVQSYKIGKRAIARCYPPPPFF